jgi:hypothetical protein
VESTPTPPGPTIKRLDDQIAWYGSRSARNRRWHFVFKVVTILAGALVPIAAMREGQREWAALLGVVIVVSEGLHQLGQFHTHWISYRSTCEALKHEKYLYLADAGPYASAAKPLVLLAERVESLVSQEHSRWVSLQEQKTKPRPEAA